MFAKGEEVVDRWTMRGTNTGDLVSSTLRIPATGKQVTVTGNSIVRFAGGKAVEHWHLADYLGLFQQLGLFAKHSLARASLLMHDACLNLFLHRSNRERAAVLM